MRPFSFGTTYSTIYFFPMIIYSKNSPLAMLPKMDDAQHDASNPTATFASYAIATARTMRPHMMPVTIPGRDMKSMAAQIFP